MKFLSIFFKYIECFKPSDLRADEARRFREAEFTIVNEHRRKWKQRSIRVNLTA